MGAEKKKTVLCSRGEIVAIAMICFLLTGSIWIKRTYGVLLNATADWRLAGFLHNKRRLFLMEVCVPAVIFGFLIIAIDQFVTRRQLITQKLRRGILLLGGGVMLVIAVMESGLVPFIRFQLHLTQKQWYDENRVVVHAFGAIDGLAYTNSWEALENSYANGYRVFECDMILTADQKLVACHDWNTGMQEGFSEENIPTREVFMNTKIYDKYTPMSIDEIVVFMREHPDVYVVTDTKSAEEEYYRVEFQQWTDTAREYSCEEILERVIVQIYHPYMYGDIKKLYPFKNFIFTLYAEGYTGNREEMKEYAKFCRGNQIDVITMRADFYTDELNEICKAYQVQLFVHTVNEQESKDYFLERSVGIYAD